MSEQDKVMCQLILDSATSVEIKECYAEGTHIQFYNVVLGGETYHMTKHDGEWVYIYHC